MRSVHDTLAENLKRLRTEESFLAVLLERARTGAATNPDLLHVHRPELFSKLTGIGPGQSITARAFARALVEGALGEMPRRARAAVLVTGVHPGRSMADASVVTRELWRLGIKNVVLSSLPNESPGRVWVP